jgi:hypothetical protein
VKCHNIATIPSRRRNYWGQPPLIDRAREYVPGMSHPRQQQHRYLVISAALAIACLVLLAVAGTMAKRHQPNALIWSTLVIAASAGGLARQSYLRAQRYRVGANSEDSVRLRLRALQAGGWHVRHGVAWVGGGDIDHLAASPDGLLTAVIETKTRNYTDDHLARVRAQALAISRQREPGCMSMPVLCLVAAHGVHRYEGGTVVVSADALCTTLELLHEEAIGFQRGSLPALSGAPHWAT